MAFLDAVAVICLTTPEPVLVAGCARPGGGWLSLVLRAVYAEPESG
jgi:hypothetical protein